MSNAAPKITCISVLRRHQHEPVDTLPEEQEGPRAGFRKVPLVAGLTEERKTTTMQNARLYYAPVSQLNRTAF